MAERTMIVSVGGVEFQGVVSVVDVTYRRPMCSRSGEQKGLDYEIRFHDGLVETYYNEVVVVISIK